MRAAQLFADRIKNGETSETILKDWTMKIRCDIFSPPLRIKHVPSFALFYSIWVWNGMLGVCSMKHQGSSDCTAGSSGAQMPAKIELKRNSCRTSEKLVRLAAHEDFEVFSCSAPTAKNTPKFNCSTCCNLRASALFVERKRHDFITSTVVSDSKCRKNSVNTEFEVEKPNNKHLNTRCQLSMLRYWPSQFLQPTFADAQYTNFVMVEGTSSHEQFYLEYVRIFSPLQKQKMFASINHSLCWVHQGRSIKQMRSLVSVFHKIFYF